MSKLKKFLLSILPNPFDRIIDRAKKKGQKKFLIAWNRGLGDIALGLYAIVHHIHETINSPEITFIIRKDLVDGFLLLKNIQKILIAPNWQRNAPYDVMTTLQEINEDPQKFDVIISWPDPTRWVSWQKGQLIPRLTWNPLWDDLHQKFSLNKELTYVGIQPDIETCYGLWRGWSSKEWHQFFSSIDPKASFRFLLFGQTLKEKFDYPHVIDLRKKTSLFELLSLIKNVCAYLILPDSGILSFTYYLDTAFPLELISLWEELNHGILKQNVASPNPLLRHIVFSRLSEKTGKDLADLLLKNVESRGLCKKNF